MKSLLHLASVTAAATLVTLALSVPVRAQAPSFQPVPPHCQLSRIQAPTPSGLVRRQITSCPNAE